MSPTDLGVSPTGRVLTRRHLLICAGAVAGSRVCPAWVPDDAGVAPQPYFAALLRVLEALRKLGAPIAADDAQRLALLARQNDDAGVKAAEAILRRYTLVNVVIEADGYARGTAGEAERTLVEQGWRAFLVRVANPPGSTASFAAVFGKGEVAKLGSPAFGEYNAAQRPDLGTTPANSLSLAPTIGEMWLAGTVFDAAPLAAALCGIPVEYRIVELFSRDHGTRRADISFYTDADPRAADFARQYRRGTALDFNCLASRTVPLRVLDASGRGCVASLTISDARGRIYPHQAMRLAPDMPFQTQIYRADGETVRLAKGEYIVESRRGPEYLRGIQTVAIHGDGTDRIEINLQRWIDPAAYGWYSGDTHIHAAGCLHYNKPSEGVSPETVIRHMRGEALVIGDILTWGPDYYYQRQFFRGYAESPAASLEHPELQAANNAGFEPRATPEDPESLIRYDLEISGFPSSHAGHPVLLRLQEQDYPHAELVEEWPSWNLPILKWAKAQGGLAGYGHCGDGMDTESTDLPNYLIPPFDGVGANEAIVDATHDAVDFLSGCEVSPTSELNVWYHMLNCGLRVCMVGETDFPCYPWAGERPGIGRSYVWLERRPTDNAGYEAWIRNLKKGRLYCGDGRSHFLRFAVNGAASGEDDVSIPVPRTVAIQARIAAWLEPSPTPETRAVQQASPMIACAWHLERARIGSTREIAVELVVNGISVDRVAIVADGSVRSVRFRTFIARSSWLALRILPSAHTHPVFVMVGNKPLRASRRSAQWCRTCVDRIWEVKSPFIRASERPAAAAAFEHARQAYETVMRECEVE